MENFSIYDHENGILFWQGDADDEETAFALFCGDVGGDAGPMDCWVIKTTGDEPTTWDFEYARNCSREYERAQEY